MKIEKIFLVLLLFISNIFYSQLRVTKDNVYNATLNKEAEILFNESYASIGKNDYGNAIRNLKKVIKLDPKFIDAYDNLAVCFRRINELDSAVVYYEKSIKIFPNNRLALNNLGLVYLQSEKYINAINIYKKSLSLNSNVFETNDAEIQMNGEPFYGLCNAYYYNKEYDLAIENGLKAYEIWKSKLPEYASDALYFVGYSYLNLNNNLKAIEVLKKSAALGNINAKEALKTIFK